MNAQSRIGWHLKIPSQSGRSFRWCLVEEQDSKGGIRVKPTGIGAAYWSHVAFAIDHREPGSNKPLDYRGKKKKVGI